MMKKPSPHPAAQVSVRVLSPHDAAAPIALAPSVRRLLLKHLPAVHRVLALGGNADLSVAYQRLHGPMHWQTAQLEEVAAGRWPTQEKSPELILLHNTLQTTLKPAMLLHQLAQLAGASAPLWVSHSNGAHWGALQRLVEAELSPEEAGWLQAHSASSLYKLLLDAGWMPHCVDAITVGAPHTDLHRAALAVAQASAVPVGTATRNLSLQHMVIRAERRFDAQPRELGPARFCVVVPTTREHQLQLNVQRSPGLQEVGARIVSCQGALNPAHALEASLHERGAADWVLLCHQDVYFAAGFGEQLNAVLASVPEAERSRTLIGFAGMAINAAANGFTQAGFVIDRLHCFDHPASERAVSVDELAIVISRDSIHQIDPQIGWHLWATELCLAAICTHRVFPRIVRLPLFHNSLNDYQLPESFHVAGRYLAAKYAAFGPIPTLCGLIPNRPPAEVQAQEASAATQLGIALPEAQAAIHQSLCADAFDQAVQQMAAAVHQHYRLDGVGHRVLYYPGLDQQLEQLGELLAAHFPGTHVNQAPQGQLLIATELYALGGHTRVLQDMAHELTDVTVVLTDLFKTYEQNPAQIQWVKERFPNANVLVLPSGSYWEKCEMLRQFTLTLNPQSIVYFGHHQDPIPLVGTLATRAPNKVFIHHGDHNPSLGCTIARLRHVDLSEGVREVCSLHLSQPTTVLPLYVPDQGMKRFAVLNSTTFSVVTSGHPAKFSRTGPVALHNLVRATLGASGGQHFHIGPLEDDWVAQIRAHLKTCGMNPERFVHLGWVPSVWETLKQLDAAFYIGSAPMGGGRVAIEAQGCGYPVAYFENHEHTALPANHPLYASRELRWCSPQQLAEVLTQAAGQHAALSATARQLYERAFSQAPFQQALNEVLTPL
jgi:hypothetical protein